MPKKAVSKSAEKIQIEHGLTLLEDIVARLENPSTTLDDSLELYKNGVDLAAKLAHSLKASEGEIAILMDKSGKVFEKTIDSL